MPRILVVDDDDLLRMTVAKAFANRGHEVVQATNGQQALATLESGAFDAVILDILMPEMDGIETLRELRGRWPRLPVIAISGGGHLIGWDTLRPAQAFGADRVLNKPFTPNEILELLDELLDRQEPD